MLGVFCLLQSRLRGLAQRHPAIDDDVAALLYELRHAELIELVALENDQTLGSKPFLKLCASCAGRERPKPQARQQTTVALPVTGLATLPQSIHRSTGQPRYLGLVSRG